MRLLERFARRREAPLWIALILAALIIGAYSPVFRADFVNCDDPLFITENPHVRSGLSSGSLRWAFAAGLIDGGAYADLWLPLTTLSHMLVVELFGLAPGAHHAVNLFLHLLNALLLFVFLKKATGSLWRSALVAAIFGLHPIQVEAVAWVSELKAVLSTFFILAALIAYTAFARRPGWKSYAALIGAYAAAALAKPITVTFPVILLLLDYWPLARLEPASVRSWRTRLLEKIPLFVMAGTLAGIYVYRGSVEDSSFPIMDLPLGLRLGDTPYFYWAYLGKTLWPTGLAFLFPHPGWLPLWKSLPATLALIAATWAALALAARRRFVVVGWLWFLVSLLPVIGLFPTGVHGITCRYMYLTIVGPAILLLWGTHEALQSRRAQRTGLAGAAAAGLILAMTGATLRQARVWRDSDSLFQHALRFTTDNHVAHRGLGIARLEEGRLDLAEERFKTALRIMPVDAQTMSRLGVIYLLTGRLKLAEVTLNSALRLKPRNAQIRNNLGILRTHQGRPGEAIREFRESVRLDPLNVKAQFNLGLALAAAGRPQEAARSFLRVLRLEPGHAPARENLARLMVRKSP